MHNTLTDDIVFITSSVSLSLRIIANKTLNHILPPIFKVSTGVEIRKAITIFILFYLIYSSNNRFT